MSLFNSDVIFFFGSIVLGKNVKKNQRKTKSEHKTNWLASFKKQFKGQEELNKVLTCLEAKLRWRTIIVIADCKEA